MSGSGTQSLFFLSLPDLGNLCCVNLFFPNSCDEGELRDKQVKTCRELVLLHSDVVASPVLGHFGGITVIMTVAFYKAGVIQAFAQKHGLQFNPPQRVFPAVLQTCLSYSVTAKLAPKWNKAGQYLIAGAHLEVLAEGKVHFAADLGGKDFLRNSGKLNAVVLELSITESQLCVSVEVNTVCLPPAEIQEFDIPAPVVKNFLRSNDAVLHTVVTNNWCHVLPSMKKGQIISISRRIPQESPFQSYMEFQKHWKNMYGYQLPSVGEDDVIYCSVHFKPIGDKLFTYPFCCIRTQPIQCFPRVDLQGVLGTFISDLKAGLESVCGFPVQMACKPCYCSNELNRPVAQCSGPLPINVITESSSGTLLNRVPSSCPRDTTQHRYSPCDSTGKQPEKKKRLGLLGSLDSSFDQKTWTSPNLATPSFSSPTNVHFTRIQAQSALPRPKLVPVFNSKSHTRHVNAAENLAVRRHKWLEGQKLTAVIRPLASCLSLSPDGSAPPALPNHFTRPSFPERMTLPYSKKEKTNSKVTRILPRLPFAQTKPPIMAEIPNNRGGDTFESKPKRLKPSVDMDATTNELSKVSPPALHAWVKRRAICVCSKDKKEELVSKVMKTSET